MLSFVSYLFFAALFFVIGRQISPKLQSASAVRGFLYSLSISLTLWGVVNTSMVRVPRDSFAVITQKYIGSALAPGRFVAVNGELGPQADVLTTGWHWKFLLTVLNDVEIEPLTIVPPGKCAIISAKDGLPIKDGGAFAPLWAADPLRMANDARYFLTEGGGHRGPQSSVLFPGAYVLNPFLWPKDQIELVDVTLVPQGTVGVVKAMVKGDVDFGQFKAEADGEMHVLTDDVMKDVAIRPQLVPVGEIGVWEIPLGNGSYYINTKAFHITIVPVTQTRLDYRGGYTRRVANFNVTADQQLQVEITPEKVEVPEDAADPAIITRVEGFEVPVEVRVGVQIEPKWAPFVVAALGLNQGNVADSGKVIEDRVVTPVLRSVIRNVTGGAMMKFETREMVIDPATKKPQLDKLGEFVTTSRQDYRVMKVIDFISGRALIEDEILKQAALAARREGVTIAEFRLADAVLPAEIAASLKRATVAQQNIKAWVQEEAAQVQRQSTENARAQAEKQGTIAEAELLAQAAELKKKARQAEGEAEQAYMEAVAKGQGAQAQILGQEQTMKLQMFQTALTAFTGIVKENPQLLIEGLKGAQKFVPNIVVNGSSSTSSSNTDSGVAALLFGSMLNPPAAGLVGPPIAAKLPMTTSQVAQ